MTDLEPAALACLERTPAVVLSLRVAAGNGIARSGRLLRGRDRSAPYWAPDGVRP